MIARIKGTVWESKPLQVVLEVNGVGYALSVPMLENLPQAGTAAEFFTFAVYREDSATLYGFTQRQERDFFTILVEKVSGIGPKTALGLLAHLPFQRLRAAVETGDLNTLKAIPGIGKKTAERLLLELKGLSMGAAEVSGISLGSTNVVVADAIAALMSLGYSQTLAAQSVNKAYEKYPNSAAEELIKLALKKG
jgi:Holliday junction DNA helicase RuvA